MSGKLNIEQLVNSILGKAEIFPSPGAWKAIQRKLTFRQFLRFNPGQFNVYYLGGLLVVGAGLVSLLTLNTRDSETAILAKASESENREILYDQDHIADQEISSVETLREEAVENQQEPTSQASYQVTDQKASENIMDHANRASDEIDAISAEGKSPDIGMEEPAKHTMVTYFTSSVQSGCAPLEVKFHNQSINAAYSIWSFGNGESLNENNPVYLFHAPGKYTVTLTSYDSRGQMQNYHQTIEVFPAPKADFEIEEGMEDLDGFKQYDLVNYSEGANTYSWSQIGDKTPQKRDILSIEFQPSVKQADLKGDVKYIELIASNEFGCMDTSLQEIVNLPSIHTPMLQFPTAFSPNPTGPSGGNYSPHEKRIDLFYPVFKEVPLTYKLKIYTRRGEHLFETDNIYIGWDGYHQQQRSAGGVYVWVAEGTWANGEEFRLQGDVTLIPNGQR